MKKLILILVCTIVHLNLLYGQTNLQELVSSSGGNFSNSDYIVSWSVGECVTETYSTTHDIMSHGLHQGTFLITSIEKAAELPVEITIYPNPVIDKVKIRVSNKEDDLGLIEAYLYDAKGALLSTKKLLKDEEEIKMAQFQGQCFFLRLYSENKMLQSFKILKTY